MEYQEIVHLVNTDPVAQTLLALPIPMHLAYVGLDGVPRVVPTTHLWDGKAFVFATPTTTYKVKAIRANPKVGFTLDIGPGRYAAEARVKVTELLGMPLVDYAPLMVNGRGTASIEIQPGIAQVHLDAAKRMVADDKKLAEWERVEREHQSEMAVISIVPTHIEVIDFITRFPPPKWRTEGAYAKKERSTESAVSAALS